MNLKNLELLYQNWKKDLETKRYDPVDLLAYSALIISSYLQSSPLHQEMDEKTFNALTMAFKLDQSRFRSLDDSSKRLVSKLSQYMNEDTQAPVISSLAQAVDYLRNQARGREQYNLVIRVLSAVDQIHQNNSPLPGVLMPILVYEYSNPFTYYFHSEHYDSEEERRDALQRLVDSLISLWNSAVQNKDLTQIIYSFPEGLCIEGIVRDVLFNAKVKQSVQEKEQSQGIGNESQSMLSLKYKDAVGIYYRQAIAFLEVCNLRPTLINCAQLIADAYEGTQFVDDPGLPGKVPVPKTISYETLLGYLESLDLHDNRYLSDNPSLVPQRVRTWLSSYPMHLHGTILATLINFASPNDLSFLCPLQASYEGLHSILNKLYLDQELNRVEINSCLSYLEMTHTFNTCFYHPIYVKCDIVHVAAEKDLNFLEALLTHPMMDINKVHDDGYSLLFSLTSAWIKLESLVRIQEKIKPIITAEALCRPINQGEYQGSSPLFLLVGNPDRLVVLKFWLEQNPGLIQGITAEALCRPITQGPHQGKSPLYWLTTNPDGQATLKLWLEQNPGLIQGISAEALCRPITQGSHQGASPLLLLVGNPHGLAILKLWLEQNSGSIQGISTEALCRPITQGPHQGVSPFFHLVSNPHGLAILKLWLEQNPGLIQGISAEALCRPTTQGPHQGVSPFFHLVGNSHGLDILKLWLEQNSGLLQGISAEALCRPIAQGSHQGASPLLLLVGNPHGQAILKPWLEQNPDLIQGITAEALCRPIHQGPHQGASPLYFLVGNSKGMVILKFWLEQNPGLIQGITAEALCRLITQGPYQWKSPLYWLTTNPDGQATLRLWLEQNPGLIQGISAEALCRPITQGSHQGASPLYWLTTNPDGQATLKLCLEQNPGLIQGITTEDLCRPITQGSHQGQTILDNLLTIDDGLEIIGVLKNGNTQLAAVIAEVQQQRQNTQGEPIESLPSVKKRSLSQADDSNRFFQEEAGDTDQKEMKRSAKTRKTTPGT